MKIDRIAQSKNCGRQWSIKCIIEIYDIISIDVN